MLPRSQAVISLEQLVLLAESGNRILPSIILHPCITICLHCAMALSKMSMRKLKTAEA